MALRVEDFSEDPPDRGDPEDVLRKARMSRFEAVYRSAVAPAWRVANAMTGNADDAADAVAEGFTRVLDMLLHGRLDGVVDLKLYSLTAVRNSARNGLRRRSKFSPEAVTDLPVTDGPSNQLTRKVSGQLAREAFDALPPHQREVLWLTAVEGMRPRQVSSILGISANSASQIAVRARAALLERYIQAHVARAPSGQCDFSVRNLGRYLAEKLPKEAVGALETHLDGCADCQARLDQIDDLGLSMRRTCLPLPVVLAGTTWLAGRAHVGPSGSPKMAEVAAPIPSSGDRWSGWPNLRVSLDSRAQLAVAANTQLTGAGRLATGAAAALIALGGTAALAPQGPEPSLSPRAGGDRPVLADQAAPADMNLLAGANSGSDQARPSGGQAPFASAPAPKVALEAQFGAALDPLAEPTASGAGELVVGPAGAGPLNRDPSIDGIAPGEGLTSTPLDLVGLAGDLLTDTLDPEPVRSAVTDTLDPEPVRSAVTDTLDSEPVRSAVTDTLDPEPVRSAVTDTLRPVGVPDADMSVTTTVGEALRSVLPL